MRFEISSIYYAYTILFNNRHIVKLNLLFLYFEIFLYFIYRKKEYKTIE